MRRIVASVAALAALFAVLAGSHAQPPIRYARPSIAGMLAPNGPGSHPEFGTEGERAAEMQSAIEGPIDPERVGDARLAAMSAARLVPFPPGFKVPTPRWTELGPKPYRTDVADYNDPYNGAPPTGWKNVSGRVDALAVDPNDRSGRTVWVGSSGGGVWVTRNGGKSFTPAWDQMASLAVRTIAFDEARPKTLYVGTGDGSTSFNSAFGGVGVYRSTDDGKTFTRVAANVRAGLVYKIAARAGRVYVATNRGLWYSKNGGNSYQDVRLPTAADGRSVDPLLLSNIVSDVAISPGRWNEVTATVGCSAGHAAKCFGNGFYRSIDGGDPGTWRRLDTPDLASGSISNDPIGVISFTYASGLGQNTDVMWAVVQDPGLATKNIKGGLPAGPPTRLNGVYRSEDDGLHWTLKATPASLAAAPGSGLVGQASGYQPGVQAGYNQWIIVSPRDPNVVLLGLEEVYQAKDNVDTPSGPATWETIGRYWNMCGYPVNVSCNAPAGPYNGSITTHGDQHAVAFGSNATTLWVGNDGGVVKQSSASGRFSSLGWTPVNETLGTTQAYYAAMGSDGTVYAGFQDNGIGKITPSREGIKTFVGDGGDVAVEPGNSDHAWGEYVGGTMFKTIDGGRNWVSVAPELKRALFIAPFKMDPLDSNHIVLGASTIVETTKGTATQCANEFVVTNRHPPASAGCDWMNSYDLGVDGSGIPRVASAVAVRGSNVYAGFCGFCGAPVLPGFAKKIHNGIATNVRPGCEASTGRNACWHIAKAKGLANRYITAIVVDPNNPRHVFVSVAGYSNRWTSPQYRVPNMGSGHVFMSNDAGESFRDISGNLPDEPARSLVTVRKTLLVGTALGVYQSTQPGVWTRFGVGLPNAPVRDLETNPAGDTVIAATYGRGIWAIKPSAPDAPPLRAVSQLGGHRRGPQKPGTEPGILEAATLARPSGARRSSGTSDTRLPAGMALAIASGVAVMLRRRRA
ncbi:MAG: hypothetical protein NVSMB57_05280 [Actinomycetota bacterium]